MLGYVDDALLLPALIWLAVRLLPPVVIEDSRVKADDWMARHGRKPTSKIGAVLIIALWLAALLGAWVWWTRR